MAREIRVAVVGAGGAAQVVHLPILKRLPEVEVAGIVDLEEVKARTIASRFGVRRASSSLSELASQTPLDAVVICSPTQAHEEGTVEALSLGCHVLCERPLATTTESVGRLIDVAKTADRHVMVAMNLRYRFDMRAIKQFMATGELGEAIFVRATWMNRRARRPRRGWRLDPHLSGGGVLMDLGTQAIDLILWTLDFPPVERVTTRLHRAGGVDATAAVQMALATGTIAAVEVSWELVQERDRHLLYVLGTQGSARSTPFQVQCTTASGIMDVTPPMDWPPTQLYTRSYRQEWAEFLRIVRGEKPGRAPDEQMQVMRVVEACYRSASEGREIEV